MHRIQRAIVPQPPAAALALHPGPRSLCIRPIAISAAVHDALAYGRPIVKAGHRHGASLAMPGTADAVFMSTPGIGLLPAHIVVRARDLDRVLDAIESNGTAAADPGGELSLQLDVEDVRTFRPRLAPCSADMGSVRARANVAAAAQWLRACTAPLGLGSAAAGVLTPGGRWLNSLIELRRDTCTAESVLRTLIGFGAGATPAGDDFAIGALAHAWATQGREASAIAAMRLLEGELPRLTTSAGATYLRAAARGEFGSHLVAWVRALPHVLPSRALALALRVAGHGATSGCDTLAGFIAAAEASDSRPLTPTLSPVSLGEGKDPLSRLARSPETCATSAATRPRDEGYCAIMMHRQTEGDGLRRNAFVNMGVQCVKLLW